MEEAFVAVAASVALCIEAAAVAMLGFGAMQAVVGAVGAALAGAPAQRQREVYLRLAVWLLLAIELTLAADIVETVIAPTWDDIGQLAAIAAIRTVLNFFLERDLREFSEPETGSAEQG